MEKTAIYGAGTIGAQQATLLIGHGIPVTVIGHSTQGLERCRGAVEQNWDDLIAYGLAGKAHKAAAMNLLTLSPEPSALKGCTFVFEAAPESRAVKEEVYHAVCQYAEPEAIIASGTSSFDADILANLTEKPEQLLVAHPFQPVHMLPLVEVVRHNRTSDKTISRTLALLKTLHRQIVCLRKSVPGFLVNRLAQALFRESIDLIEREVCTAADIDKAVKYAIGMRYASIGLLEYYDAVGFELEKVIAQNVYPDLCSTKEIQETTSKGLLSGQTGQAAGTGLFDWSQKNADDFRLRKQSPYFYTIKEWTMPESILESNVL